MPEVELLADEAAVEEIVVLEEAAAIQETRELMKAARDRIWPLAYHGDGGARSGSLGRLAHALETAETALFDVLNEASSYCDCAASGRTLKASWDRDDATTESTPES